MIVKLDKHLFDGDNMTKVTFYKPEKVEDKNLKFAVIAARYQDKWVYCRHKKRSTWEIPGGHRELGETIIRYTS